MAKCTNCGADLPDGAKFCGGCGTATPAPAPAAPAKLFCSNCGTELAPGTKFCGNCGAAPAPAPAAPAKLFCGNCGTELAPGTKFCGNCGAAPNATPGAAPAPALPLNQNKKMLIIIAAAVVVVIGVIIGVVFMVSSGKEEAVQAPATVANDENEIRKVADAFCEDAKNNGFISNYTFKHIKKVSDTYSYVCYETTEISGETTKGSVHVIKKDGKWKAVEGEDNWSPKDESRWK